MAYFTHMSTLVGGSFTHTSGITDLEVMVFNGQARLYSASFADGGLASYALADGQVATYLDDLGAGPSRGTYGVVDLTLAIVNGVDILVPSGKYDDKVVVHELDSDGAFDGAIQPSGSYQDFGGFTNTAVITTSKGSFLFASQSGESGIKGYKFGDNLSLSYMAATADDLTTHLGDVSAMATMQILTRSFLFVASSFDAGVTSLQIKNNGTTYLRDSVDPQDGTGFSLTTVIETATVCGRNYLLMGSAGSDSIGVFHVSNKGILTETDYKQDTLLTRFSGVEAIETLTYGSRVFVLAGGSDDGISLFELHPDGTLFLLESISDQLDTSLQNITSITAHVFNGQVQVFVAGSGEAGITQFSLDLGQLGDLFLGEKTGDTLVGGLGDDVVDGGRGKDILSGGMGDDLLLGGNGRDVISGDAGDDRLIDGIGRDTMTGGAGADVFVFCQDGVTDKVTDFTLGVDKLDLSGFDMLYHYSALDIVNKSWGFLISVQGELMRLYSSDSQSSDNSEFSQDDFIF
ncbi:MAG: serralysin [Paracoccaceae bacterium]